MAAAVCGSNGTLPGRQVTRSRLAAAVLFVLRQGILRHSLPSKAIAEPYVTSVEQTGIDKGLQQGLRQGEARPLLRLLDRKFGSEAAQAHRARLEAADLEQLAVWLDRILAAEPRETIFH